MIDTIEFQNRIERQFDGYCRTVLKNSLKSLLVERRRRVSREIVLEPVEIDRLYSKSDVSETRLIHAHQLDQWTSVLLDDLIAEAIYNLDDEQRTIILLYYFLGRSDYQIADEMDMVRRTVSRRRMKALYALKDYLNKEESNEQQTEY